MSNAIMRLGFLCQICTEYLMVDGGWFSLAGKDSVPLYTRKNARASGLSD